MQRNAHAKELAQLRKLLVEQQEASRRQAELVAQLKRQLEAAGSSSPGPTSSGAEDDADAAQTDAAGPVVVLPVSAVPAASDATSRAALAAAVKITGGRLV